MSFLPTPTLAPVPKTKDSKRIALFYAIILVVMVVAQLFTYEKFLELMVGFGFPVGVQGTYFITAVLVSAEVFALPFLLRMPLSRAFRWVSMVAGWIVALLWVKLSFWIVFSDVATDTIGFLGTVVGLMPGWWAIFVSVSFAILAAWASWGMWPYAKAGARKTKR